MTLPVSVVEGRSRSSQGIPRDSAGVSYYGSPCPAAPSELDVDTSPAVPEPLGRCLHCGVPVQQFLCWSCVRLLRRQLVEVPWLLARLHESAYGEAKVAKRGLRVSTGERLPSLPLNSRAADLLRDAARLVSWWEQVGGVEVRGPRDVERVEHAARKLAAEPGAMMSHPWAPDALRWVLNWRDAAERVIDLPPDVQYAGPCQEWRTEEVVDPRTGGARVVRVSRCGTPLYVEAEAVSVSCPRCGTVWGVDALQRQALARVDDVPRTQAELFRLLKLVGREVPRSTFYKLMTRVEAHGYNAEGLPVYTYSSVVAALDAAAAAAEQRRVAEDERRASVLALHESGLSPSAIARSLGVRYPAVVRILGLAGVDAATESVDGQTTEVVSSSSPSQVMG
ncbi:hypothetical protein SEA_LILPHARAOH_61 [Mycobacterium phage LilPharaoh]|uniref:Helix-turn-helix DNA binding domain protein n=1 Tax=Mycobacterium phage Amelie TaxID=1913035 RepID=A0A1J0GRG2_9CAUD|nr:hypothetical protein AVV01_gp62 [Mycobacterium phage Enkosi]YP_009952578.1 hypothetical protein I5G92_gp60 [Mycobacterium phage Amelie]ATN90514.1 hypothetical protein SEA_LILPHARAOH_61 [Mycobacterium phage LilPharaoh]AVP42638.1 hypothetical protein SEA_SGTBEANSPROUT_61 [Mycobacterium phage SgtBeansprout]AXC37166.1 hypothetical protein SEA_BIGLEBOPS_60 [Mycobacterium phage Biglebops]QGJ93345.1 hypothetical protein PBI_MDAVU_61 [Mycobacterium phage Mdavu]UQS94460.1 DNA binding protein [Mycob